METTGGRISRLRIDEQGDPKDGRFLVPPTWGKCMAGWHPSTVMKLWAPWSIRTSSSVLTPQGDLRVLLMKAIRTGEALEQAFFQNHVTQDVLFPTGRGIAPDGFGDVRGATCVPSTGILGTRIPYFRSPIVATDGALEPIMMSRHFI